MSDRLKLAAVLGFLSWLLIGWETGLIHRRDVVGVAVYLVVLAGCVVAWRWWLLRW